MARALAAWAREAQRECGGRATREDLIHLTLAFLGDADPGVASAAARAAPGKVTSLPLEVARYWKHNRIVWVGAVRSPAPLLDLAQRLARTLRGQGFRHDKREYAPHVTLVRDARRAPASAAPAIVWPMADFVLVRSTPGARRSNYEIVKRYPFTPL